MNVLHFKILSNLWHTFSFGPKSEDNVVYYVSWGQIIIFVKENNRIKLKLVTSLRKGDNDIVCRKTRYKWVELCNLNHMNRLSLTKENDIIQNIMERGKLKYGIASWTCLWDSWIFSLLSTYFLRERKKLAPRVVLNRHENNSLHFKYLFTEKLDENVS